MQNQPVRKKKKFVPGATKALLALTSVAGTMGLWNVISNQSLVEAQKASNTIDGPLELADMPTVVALAQVNLDRTVDPGALPNPPLDHLRVVTPPATKAPAARATAPASSGGNSNPAPVVTDPAQSAPVATDPVVAQPPATAAPAPTATTGSSK